MIRFVIESTEPGLPGYYVATYVYQGMKFGTFSREKGKAKTYQGEKRALNGMDRLYENLENITGLNLKVVPIDGSERV